MQRLEWQNKLRSTIYKDPITGREVTYEELVQGYIGESDKSPGGYGVLNTVNRAMDADPTQTLRNLLKKDSNGNLVLDDDGNPIIQFRHLRGKINEYSYNPMTGQIISDVWGGIPYGLNVDGSAGTFSDLLTRVKSESKALSDALGMSRLDTDLVVGRGAGWDSLERFGIREGDTVETIFAKLTKDGNTYCDSGFMSSTPELGGGYMQDYPINFIMNVNQGTSVGNFAGYNFWEREVLLDYGTKFNIDSVKQDAYGKIYIFLSQK